MILLCVHQGIGSKPIPLTAAGHGRRACETAPPDAHLCADRIAAGPGTRPRSGLGAWRQQAPCFRPGLISGRG